MTVKDAAERWNLSQATIRKYCRLGLIPNAIKESNKWSIPDESIYPKTKKQITKEQIIDFNKNWAKTNESYVSMFKGKHLLYPDLIQKWILKNFFDSTLVVGSSKTYDFKENIELKSSTKKGGQCRFGKNQVDCKRIIHFSIIENEIKIVELSEEDVKKINRRTKGQAYCTCLEDYHKNSIRTIKLNLLTLERL